MKMAYKGLLPYIPGLDKELKRSRVLELTDDVWMLEGYISNDFLFKPASSNIFMLRDGDTLLILDTGTYPIYRERMLEIMRMYRKDGVKRLVLMVTQGHFDHACNNDVILESGFSEWSFLLTEPERKVIEFLPDWMRDWRDLEEYYDPYAMFPARGSTAVINLAGRLSTALARSLLRANFAMLFRGVRTLAEKAEILYLKDRVERRFGDVTLTGWEVGRFFAVHDASHTPGHISLYDAEKKLMLSGDVTIEINPAFFYSSLDRCIDYCSRFRRMAEQGFIELASDSHRTSTFFPLVYEQFGMEPLHEIQLVDAARGREECIAFFEVLGGFYSILKREVMEAHSRVGEATVLEIMEEMSASPDPAVKLKMAMSFPKFPNRPEVMVARVLKDTGARRRIEKKRILFSP
jgi:glyoxylase-like metal-dependent hydrolase (beta-lactamase superfamily II)